MGSVTIRIEPQQGPGKVDFDLHLIEEGGNQTFGLLTRAELTTGRWTANLDAVIPPPATDIVANVSGVTPERRTHADFEAIAKTLYGWLFPAGNLHQRWLALRNSRLYVETSVDALARLPWEMACTQERPLLRPALIGGLCRLAPASAPSPAADRRSAWPFRILIVIGCSAAEEATLDIGSEIKAIERIFHPLGRTVDIHCMYRPQKADMMQWIKRFHPHIFHFAGHGEKVAGVDQYGLRIENDNRVWIWAGDAIDVDLPAARWIPQFVFLNACRSSADQGGSWSPQKSFLAAGAKAVLGMQADVRGDLSGKFAATLYERLANGAFLEDALNEARTTILNELTGPQDLGWALPAMAMTQRDMRLFEPHPLPSDEPFEKCGEFEDARLFANCREPRRIFTNWAYPCVASEKTENVLLVVGEQNTGKSHLLKWCMENWVIGGARVRYIKLHDDGASKTFLSVLRQIRNGEADDEDIKTQYLHAGLAKSAFRQFNWHLNNLIRTGAAGEWVEAERPEADISDENEQLTALSDKRQEGEIGALFLEALQRAAEEKPLILVFDQLEGAKGERLLPQDQFELLVRHLFRPIAEAQSLPIKVAIITTKTQVTDFRLGQIPSERVARYDVQANVPDSELIALAAEMLWFQDEDKVIAVATSLFLLSDDQEPPLKGLARLAMVRETIQKRRPTFLNAVRRMR